MIRDEGEYAYAAQIFIRGGIPYEQVFIQKPPMVVYSYQLAHFLLPHTFWSPRLLAYVCVALATALLGLIARLEFGRSAAWPAMWLVTPMILLPGIDQFTANTEMFMLLPLLATSAVYCHGRQTLSRGPGHWFSAGVLCVATLLYKYTTLPVLAYVFAVWSVEILVATNSAKQLCRCWLAGFIGGTTAAAAILGFFLIHDGGARLWECTVQFNRYYVASSNFGLAALWSYLHELWSDWWVLFLMPWAIFLKPQSRLWFWLGMLISAIAATGASCYGHYYIIMMPFLALLNAEGICALAEWTAQRLGRPVQPIRWLLLILTLLLVLQPDIPWLTCSRTRFAEAKMSQWSPFPESQVVALRVSQLSSPTDFVFVAGSEPQILYYAGRLSPTRFILAYPMMIPSPLAAGYQQEAIRDLQQHPPKLIILAQNASSWLWCKESPKNLFDYLKPLLRNDYDLVGGFVKDKQGNRWSEPLHPSEMTNSSLLLFRKKNE